MAACQRAGGTADYTPASMQMTGGSFKYSSCTVQHDTGSMGEALMMIIHSD